MTSAPRTRAVKAATAPARRLRVAAPATVKGRTRLVALPEPAKPVKRAAKKAPPVVVEEPEFDALAAIAALPENYRECRDRRHPWRDHDVVHRPEKHLFEVWLRCPKCKSFRIRLIGEQGQYVGNDYDYAPGYVIKGLGHMNETGRDALRLQAMRDMQARLAAKPGTRK